MPRRAQPPERAALIEQMTPSVPQRYRGVWSRAMKGSPSLKNAIQAKCLECSAFQRVEVAECACHQCPLWLYRSYGESG
jgi:hypothetical protein